MRLAACEALAKLPEAAADSVPGLIGRLRDEFHPVRGLREKSKAKERKGKDMEEKRFKRDEKR